MGSSEITQCSSLPPLHRIDPPIGQVRRQTGIKVGIHSGNGNRFLKEQESAGLSSMKSIEKEIELGDNTRQQGN
jgi:hypothetical protein